MIAVDTNVLIRLITRDDPRQAARAASLMQTEEVWIAKTVLLETEWVLRSLYGFDQKSVNVALRKLAGLRNVCLEDPLAIGKALDWSSAALDFADALHLASSGEADRFATFDHSFARNARKAPSIEVVTI